MVPSNTGPVWGFTDYQIFSGLTLGPGTFIVTMSGSVPCCSILESDWLARSGSVVTHAFDVSAESLSLYAILNQVLDITYAPASTMSEAATSYALMYSVEGSLVPAPEPQYSGLFTLGTLGLRYQGTPGPQAQGRMSGLVFQTKSG